MTAAILKKKHKSTPSRKRWRIVEYDELGPTIYYAAPSVWVFGDNVHKARIFTEDEKATFLLPYGSDWEAYGGLP